MIRLRQLAIVVFAVAGMLCCGCRSADQRSGKVTPDFYYNKFNIHVVESISKHGNVSRASYANWVSPFSEHWVIPPNTKLRISYRRRGLYPGYEMTLEDNRKVFFEFNARNTGMSAAEYLETITGPSPIRHTGLSAKDQEGIKAGRALIGMSKRGIRVALGHPSPSRTPSLKENQWIYWRDRYRTMVVQFDAGGKVASVR